MLFVEGGHETRGVALRWWCGVLRAHELAAQGDPIAPRAGVARAARLERELMAESVVIVLQGDMVWSLDRPVSEAPMGRVLIVVAKIDIAVPNRASKRPQSRPQ